MSRHYPTPFEQPVYDALDGDKAQLVQTEIAGVQRSSIAHRGSTELGKMTDFVFWTVCSSWKHRGPRCLVSVGEEAYSRYFFQMQLSSIRLDRRLIYDNEKSFVIANLIIG